MKQILRLTWFFFTRQLISWSAVLYITIVALVVGVALLTSIRMQEDISGEAVRQFGSALEPLPIVSMDVGSVHAQVWEATNTTYLSIYPVQILLPLRLCTRWLLLIFPFVGLILASCDVSQEVESGVAQTLYSAPVKRSTLGLSRLLGYSASTWILVCLGLAVALAAASMSPHLDLTGSQLLRGLPFALILSAYTSAFVLVGNLVSTALKSSLQSILICITIGLTVFAVQLVGENLLMNLHREYPTTPAPPNSAVRRFLSDHDMWAARRIMPTATLESEATPAVFRYLMELGAHGERVYEMVRADYNKERWLATISPFHLVWGIAQQLLQDRHDHATDIFAPIDAMDPPPSILTSLRAAWPEILGIAIVWLVLLGLNIRALSRLEV